MAEDEVYCIELIESESGQSRRFFLGDGLTESELNGLIAASFEFKNQTCVGLRDDENDIIYPLSMLFLQPGAFHERKLSLVIKSALKRTDRGSSTHSNHLIAIGVDSQDTLVTEDHMLRVFELLDKNDDGKVHKEEFIEVLTQVYENLFSLDAGLAFAYSCLSSLELAIYTAQKAFEGGTYCLDYSDFSAWYMSGGNDQTKVIMIRAMQQYEIGRLSGSSAKSIRRNKSLQNLKLSQLYDDKAVSNFVLLSQRITTLTPEKFASFYERFDVASLKTQNVDTKVAQRALEAFFDDSIKYSKQQDVVQIVERYTNTAFDMLEQEETGRIHLGQLISLLVACHPEQDFKVFDMVYKMYRSGSHQYASEDVLYTHLLVVLVLLFYFGTYGKSLNCSPESIAHAVFIKILGSVEVQRQTSRYLTLNEFVELFVHGLRLIVATLQISHGFIFSLLSNLIDTQNPNRPSQNHEQVPPQESSFANGVFTGDDAVINSPTGASLEDDQVSSYMVGYNGSAVSMAEAREALGLFEYEAYDVAKYAMQLSDEEGKIETLTFSRGILKLLGEHYVNISVLQRSVVDFILDRIALTFDVGRQGEFDMLEICIALLLFCEDDTYSRPEVILALLRPKVLKFSTVRAAVLILFQMAYSLNPAVSAEEYMGQAEADSNALCITYYMKEVSPKNDFQANFSHAQFLAFMQLVFIFLEEETEQRRMAALDKSMTLRDNENENGSAEGNEAEDENGEDGLLLKTFSEDEASDGFATYLNDKEYPPSSVVLELRAACSVLGLEIYSADDLIDKLGAESKQGKIDRAGWARWLGGVFQKAKISDYDIDLAIFIGHKIFDGFQHDDHGMIKFAHVAAGLAFLCAKSPLEERIMVAFTLSDEDSDGFITFAEFCMLIKAVLTIISVCSKIVETKITALGVTIAELSRETATQGIIALGLSEDDEINLEMLSDLAEDYLKLASFM